MFCHKKWVLFSANQLKRLKLATESFKSKSSKQTTFWKMSLRILLFLSNLILASKRHRSSIKTRLFPSAWAIHLYLFWRNIGKTVVQNTMKNWHSNDNVYLRLKSILFGFLNFFHSKYWVQRHVNFDIKLCTKEYKIW